MSENKKKYENNENITEKENFQEDYTFVRETIKKKPPAFVRMLIKAGKVLGLGVAFGIGVCLVLAIFNKDIRSIFTGDKDSSSEEEGKTTDNSDIKNDDNSDEAMSLDEKIEAQLADVVVVYYSDETESLSGENESSQETNVIYQGEDITADISDNKEVQTTTSSEEKTTEKKTAAQADGSEETQQSTESRIVKEKKHYTGLLTDVTGDVFICVEKNNISSGGDILVSLGDGNYIKSEVYGYDEINGLAVLRVYARDINEETKKGLRAAALKNADEMNEGDKLIYIGNPYGNGRLMYTGTLAGVDDGHCNYDTFYRGVITDISGENIKDGFIFNENGDIVAMVTGTDEINTSGNKITGVCMNDIMFMVKALVSGSPIKHIGIKGEAVTEDMRELTRENMPDGMYVTDVARNSSAYRSGIMVGDIVVSVGDNEVKDLRDIQSVLQKAEEKSDITLVVKRKIGTSYNEFTIKVPVESSRGTLDYDL